MFYSTLQMRKAGWTNIMLHLGEIVFCGSQWLESVLEYKLSGDRDSCYVITFFLCKMKIKPVTTCFKFIAVSRGNLSLLLYINRLSSAAGQVERTAEIKKPHLGLQ